MKKITLSLALLVAAFTTSQVHAQAFDKSTKIITIAIGAGEMIHVPTGNDNPLTAANFGVIGYNFNRTIITGQLAIEGEFAVHKYVGVGFTIGVGGRTEAIGLTAGGFGTTSYAGFYYKEVNVPIGVMGNFHFYQLIADKKGGNLHADKLDIYAGITAGSGVAIHPYKNDATGQKDFNDILAFGGPHAGVNYYFTPKIGINGEVGWGVTVIHAGLVIKL